MAPPKPLEGDDFRNPALTGPRQAHDLPNGGLFSIYADCHVAAPPKAVYDTLLAVRQYEEWTGVITNLTITKHPHAHDAVLLLTQGTFMTLKIRVGADEEPEVQRVVCAYLGKLRAPGPAGAAAADDPKKSRVTRIRWVMDNANLFTPRFVFRSVWTHELEEQADGSTVYRTWIVYAGIGAKMVRKRLEAALPARFQEFTRDLKKRVEELGAEQAAAATKGARIDPTVKIKHPREDEK